MDDSIEYLFLEQGDYLLQENGDNIISGDASRITTVTDAYKTAQESSIRKVKGLLLLVSHYKQYGDSVVDEKEMGGSSYVKLGQGFVAPKSMDISGVEVFISGSDGNDAKIKASIQGDTGGLPDGNELGSGVGATVNDYDYIWRRVDFTSAVSITAGTTYHIVIENNPTSDPDNFYVAVDTKGTYDLGCEKYVSGAWTADNTKMLITRLVSSLEADNEQEIEEVLSWKIVRDRDVPAYQFESMIANINSKYSIGQLYSSYLEGGKKIKAYLGLVTGGTLLTYYLAFLGLTENSPASSGEAIIRAKCYMSKLIADRLSASDLGGDAYEDMIESVATHAGIDSFSLRVTGKTSRTGIEYKDMSASDIAEKIREATIDRLQFKNTNTLYSTERAKANISGASTIKYYVKDSNFLTDLNVETQMDKLVNRITVTNDESGETTTDASNLNVGYYQTIGTGSGVLGSSTETQNVTISFSKYACIYNQWSNSGSASTAISEIGRDCGDYNSYGSMVFEVRNKNYPTSSGTYNITANGCPISNAGSITVLAEKINQSSWESFGNYSQRIDNRIFANTTDASDFCDSVLNEKAYPIYKIKSNCRGIVDLYPDDIIAFYDAKTFLDHIGIVTLCELNYDNEKNGFSMYLEAEKMKYQEVDFLLLEDSNYLLQETGYKIHQ
jgi:hypothetical protein